MAQNKMAGKFVNNVNEKNLVLTRAQGAVIARDFPTAARLYKQLLKEDPSNVDYLKELGAIYVKNGEDEKAIPYYEQIITFYPHYIDAMNSLGAIYRRLKRYEESIDILEKAVDEGRQTADVNYNLGFTYREMGNYDDAIESFSSVISENPSDVLAYNHLGAIYLAKKDYEKSIASFKRGLQIDQNHPILNYNLAHCYSEAKMYSDAIRCYENALKTKPGWVDAIKDFSKLLVKCQKSKEASDLVKHSIQLYPNDTKLLGMLGSIYLEQYDYDSAEKTFKRAKKVDNQDIQILTGLAEALEKGEKPEEALENVLDAMEIAPDNNDLKKQYIQTLLSAKKIDAAGTNVKELFLDNKEDPQVLDLYGQYLICNEQDDEANQCFSKINAINHSYKDYLLSAAGRYDQIGKAERAEQMAKEFVAKDMRNPAGYNMLGRIYTNAGNYKSAIESYDKSRNLRKPNVLADKKIDSLKNMLDEEQKAENQVSEVVEEVIPEAEEVNPQVTALEEENSQNDEFDFGTMGDNVPMAEALSEKEEDFFDEDEISEEELDSLDKNSDEVDDEDKKEAQKEIEFAKVAEEALKQDENISPFDDLDDEKLSEKQQLLDNNDNGNTEEDSDEIELDDVGSIDTSAGFKEPEFKGDGEREGEMPVSEMLDNVDSDNFDFDQFDETSAYEENDNSDSEPDFDVTKMPDPFGSDISQSVQNQPTPSQLPAQESAPAAPVYPQQSSYAPPVAPEQNAMNSVAPEMPAFSEYQDAFMQTTERAMDALRRANELAAQNSKEQEFLDEQRDKQIKLMQEKHENQMSQMEQEYSEQMEQMRQQMEALQEENENLSEEKMSSAAKSLMSTAESLLPTIEKILSDDDSALENADEIELFKKLLELCQFLPEDEKAAFMESPIRMQMEYIISKMSGVPGLLKTAQSLKKAGVLQEESEDESNKEFTVTNHELRKVLKYMKKLSCGLEDLYLANAMCNRIDSILEKIEIAENSTQIF